MSNLPADLKYTESHEWVRVEADGTLTIGITDLAQEQLGDIVFLELPEAGRKVNDTIVPLYAELQTQLNGPRRSERTERDRVRQALEEYVELRKEGWDLVGQSMTADDIVSEGQAILRFEAAQKIVERINPAASKNRPTSPVDLHTELAVLSVAERQAVQAYAGYRNQFASEELSDVRFADALEREILPVWQSARRRFSQAAAKFPADQQAIGKRVVNYLEMQTAGWQMQIEGLRQKDRHQFDEGERKLSAAKAASEGIWQPATGSEK